MLISKTLNAKPETISFHTPHSLTEVRDRLAQGPVYRRNYFTGDWRLKFQPGLHREMDSGSRADATYRTEMIVPAGKSRYRIYAQLQLTQLEPQLTRVELETFFPQSQILGRYLSIVVIPILSLLVFGFNLLAIPFMLFMYLMVVFHYYNANKKRQQLIDMIVELIGADREMDKYRPYEPEVIA